MEGLCVGDLFLSSGRFKEAIEREIDGDFGPVGRWRGPRRALRTSTTSSGLWSRKTEAAEAAALGTAICAGIGTGVHFSLDAATEQIVRVLRTHEPDPQSRDRLGEAYET